MKHCPICYRRFSMEFKSPDKPVCVRCDVPLVEGEPPQVRRMDREYLREAAQVINSRLPDNHGFILLVAPFGEGENNRLTYISSMQRADAINLLKEWLIKCSGEEEWMRHIK